ncbi:MAG: winged helix-turn-helix domain-containing protein [Acidobacteria bacterium]|nr:winged helix-turn-helix domain-containing protein [Acidobacteriota bacterium]
MLYRNGDEIPMVPKAAETLLALLERRGKIVSKEELLEAVWPDTVVEESNLFLYLSLLRKTLGTLQDGRPYVETLRRRGYRFNGEVHLVEEAVEDKNYELTVDEFEQSRANVQSQAVRVHIVKNRNRNTTESEKISSASPVLPALIPFESSHDLTPSKNELAPDELSSGGSADVVEGAQPEVRGEEVSNVITAPARARSAWRRNRLIILAGVIIAAFGVPAFYLWRVRTKTAPTAPVRIVAVLPFKPLVVENRDEALELGMADALITKLGNTRGVIVRPLTSARRYGGMDQDPLAAGRELQVDSVLDGSVQRWGDRIRVTARLVSVGGKQLWAGQFDEKFTDIFAVQDSVSARVVGALALHLSDEEERRLTKRYTDNAAAYELYLKGRYHLFKLRPTEVRKGGEFFQEAVRVDPAYALAYTGVADAYRILPITSDVAPKDAFPNAREAVTKALELDDSLADAHASLGWIKFWFDWDWAGSESEFRRAIELNPNNVEARRGYAHLLSITGRHEEALSEVERARELDPVSLIVNTLQGQFLHSAGRDDEAVRRFEKTFELDPNFWVAHVNLAYVLIHKKMYGQALTELAKAREQSGGNTQTIALTGYVLALSGERERARGVLEELRRLSGQRYVPPYNLAIVHHGLGEREEALGWLERAYEERDVMLTFLAVDRKWDALRSERTFVSLLERMNLSK